MVRSYNGTQDYQIYQVITSQKLIRLDLSRNNITSADGLEKFPQLEKITMSECPISFNKEYRELVASKNKNIQQIDHVNVTEYERDFNPKAKNKK